MTSGNTRADDSTYRNYIVDLMPLLKEQARGAKRDSEASAAPDKSFAAGRLFAYHEIISLMQQQAEAFGISLTSLGLHDINPETDLL